MHKLLCLTALPLAMLLALTMNATAGNTWQEVRNDEQIVVMQRDVTGSGYKETQGTMDTDASLFAILAVLKDSAACVDWLYKCKHGETVATYSNAERVYYTVIDAPLLLSDRDMYVRSKVTWDAARERIDIALLGVANYAPERRGKVRVLDLRGHWILQRQTDGRVQITYLIYSNPQVGLRSAANSMMIRSVYDTLKSVSQLAHSQKYSTASFTADELGSLTLSE